MTPHLGSRAGLRPLLRCALRGIPRQEGTGAFVFDFTAATLPSGATLARASAGSYHDAQGVLRSAAADVGRFDHDVAGALLGLLLEPQRTSIQPGSAVLTWNPMRLTIAEDAVTAPDGSLTGELLIPTAEAGTHYITRAIAGQDNALPWSQSFYARPGPGGSYRHSNRIANSEASGNFVQAFWNLAAKSVTAVASGGTGSGAVAGMDDHGDWLRCWVSGTPDTGGTLIRSYGSVSNASDQLSYLGDGTSGIYLWGGQLEQGAFPTSYIPTAGGEATRSADLLTLALPDGDWMLTAQTPAGVLTGAASVTGGEGYLFDWSDFPGGAGQRHLLRLTASLG